jgi:hypothetical protein
MGNCPVQTIPCGGDFVGMCPVPLEIIMKKFFFAVLAVSVAVIAAEAVKAPAKVETTAVAAKVDTAKVVKADSVKVDTAKAVKADTTKAPAKK